MRIYPRKVKLKGYGRDNAIKILGQGDQHTDDPGHIPKAFDAFLEAVAKAPEGSGAFLLGDPFSFANTRSQRAFLKMFPEATEDAQESVDGFVREMAKPVRKKLETIKDRIWGTVEGNHGWTFRDGTTVDHRIADLLGVIWSDGMLICHVALETPPSGGGMGLNIVCHHGATAAQTTAGDINSLIKHAGYFSNAHIVMEGHTHGLSVTPDERMVIVNSRTEIKLKHQICWTARCGGAVRGYRQGSASYPERRMLKPTMPGHVEFTVWLEKPRMGKTRQTKRELHLCIEGRVVPLQGVSVGVAG